jgi:hypothetical protein
MPGTDFVVDPDDFLRASDLAGDAAHEVSALRDRAARTLSRLGAMAGSDSVGIRWARTYDGAAAHAFAGLDRATRGCRAHNRAVVHDLCRRDRPRAWPDRE